MFKLDLEKQRNQRSIKLPTSVEKARDFQKNIYFCFNDYANAFDCMDHNKLWKILKEMGIPYHPTCLLRNLYAGQEATVRIGHGTMDCSKLGMEYIKAVCCHFAYLTYMQSEPVKLLSCVWLFAIPWTVVYQAPLSMEFSRQEYWSGLPFPSPGELPDPGIKPRSPALQADALPSELPEYIKQNARLDEAQAGIKIAERNINNQ